MWVWAQENTLAFIFYLSFGTAAGVLREFRYISEKSNRKINNFVYVGIFVSLSYSLERKNDNIFTFFLYHSLGPLMDGKYPSEQRGKSRKYTNILQIQHTHPYRYTTPSNTDRLQSFHLFVCVSVYTAR